MMKYQEKFIFVKEIIRNKFNDQIPRKVDPLRQVVATSACTGDFLRLAKLSGEVF